MTKYIDVAIIGGGISGLSAAVYTAEAGLKTMVFDTGKSQIKPISTVWNFPGIPEGISGQDLLAKMKEQMLSMGAEYIEASVRELKQKEEAESRFLLEVSSKDKEVDEVEEISAKYVIVASNVHLKPLQDMGVETEVSPAVPSGKISRVVGGSWNGETKIPGLYVAGLLSGISTQSIIAAGQGTQVAMDIISLEKGKAHVWHDK
ncbi:NAD(P)/FAD-dependent oxidoreductase [Salipaludibacillus daqingensis]|uniref:NAD(P)/FAD-dependent oxidoreductase n=1 Tax=Salipaludibacillus daqingensis TaxID=3041001 RepID=UPI00247366A6|nr:NAD(P)/FAD-dependent oxidoreductase [Salipaludibacillus daqingensis]